MKEQGEGGRKMLNMREREERERSERREQALMHALAIMSRASSLLRVIFSSRHEDGRRESLCLHKMCDTRIYVGMKMRGHQSTKKMAGI